MLVEILCGVLSGAAYGPNIRRWGTYATVANLVGFYFCDAAYPIKCRDCLWLRAAFVVTFIWDQTLKPFFDSFNQNV